MSRRTLLPALLLWLVSAPLQAAPALEYTLRGLEGELERNALAWLGDPPATPQERLIFVVSIEQKIAGSLQALGYYRPDVEVEIHRTEPVWQVAIRVDPGEPVHIRHVSLKLLGEAAGDEAFAWLLEEQPFRSGEVLHHGTFEAFKRRLLSLGLQRGYFDGAVELGRVEVEPVGGTADIFLHYNSGRRYQFGEILFDEGQISRELLSPLTPFHSGDPFDQGLLQRLQTQLQRTGYFATVLASPVLERSGDDVRVPVELKLFPAPRHSFEVGVGYSTDTEERFSFTWHTPKLNRLGHSQETRLQYSSVNPGGRITYTIPMEHPLDDLLLLSAGLEENEFGDLNSRQKELGVKRDRRRNGWQRSYSLRALEEDWATPEDHLVHQYLLPGISLSHRKWRGVLVDPELGLSHIYRLELGGEQFGSDADLARATASFRYFMTLAPRHRLVTRTEFGAVFVSGKDRDELAPSLGFFAGGSQSIRGFGYQSIGSELSVRRSDGTVQNLVVGGTRLATASLEYQYSFTPRWRGAIFIDGGDAFEPDSFDLNYGAGFGIHYLTPVGSVRLELANPLSEDDPSWRLHLAVGVQF